MRAHYFLGKQLLASAPAPTLNGGPDSLAYFCQTCGEVWGRVVVENAPQHLVESVPCPRHTPTNARDWGALPGSFLLGSSATLGSFRWAGAVDFFPPPVVEREFHLLINHLIKTGFLQ